VEASARSRAWAAETLAHLTRLARSEPDAGVTLVEGLELSAPPAGGPAPAWHADVPGLRPARPEELPPGRSAGPERGWVMRVPVVVMPVYLAWLARQLANRGIPIRLGHPLQPEDLDDACAARPAVVNCTGLDARELVGDEGLFPIRGQIVRVTPGHATRFIQDADDPRAPTYIIPRPDCTVLGGSSEVGEWDLSPSAALSADILSRCVALDPALAHAEVSAVLVGLRPGRAEVRLEAERRGGGRLVHNYGHGGAGLTLSWGCAGEVARLVGPP
jgi:D-amino-acid oxidase